LIEIGFERGFLKNQKRAFCECRKIRERKISGRV